MTCDRFRALYLEVGPGGLDTAGRAHLATCTACRATIDELDDLRRSLADPLLWETPPPHLEDRVVDAVVPSHGASATKRRRRWPALAAAAVLLVALVGGMIAAREPAPDWTVTLTGTELAPGARAIAAGWNTPAGSIVELDAENLPPAPDGMVYELWFSRDGVHLSAGTFRDPRDVRLTVGASRRELPRLWVTLEPIDGDPTPSGRTVLDTGPTATGDA